jgi:hypothetical protein
VERGDTRSADIQTEVFFFPSAQVAELEGSFTNTQRMLQWHFKAAAPQPIAVQTPGSPTNWASASKSAMPLVHSHVHFVAYDFCRRAQI